MTSSSATPRVAVIGGGIIGLSIAWRLVAGGARVELFERGALAGEATHVAAGMLAPVSEADPAEPALLALGLESARAWPGFAAELEAASAIRGNAGHERSTGNTGHERNTGNTGHERNTGNSGHERNTGNAGHERNTGNAGHEGSSGHEGDAGQSSHAGNAPHRDAQHLNASGAPGAPLIRTDGTLLVARDADEGRWLQREAALRAEAGLDCELLTPTQARRLEPDLAPGLRGALHVPGDHSVDPRAIASSLADAARAAGARLHEHAQVESLDDPRLEAFDRVVISSGAWPVARAALASKAAMLAPVGPVGPVGPAAPADLRSDGALPAARALRAPSALGDPPAPRDRSLPRGARLAAPAAGPTDTHPVKGQLLVLRDPGHATRGEPIVTRTLRAQSIYLVPRGDGRYIAGATMEHRGYDRTVTAWAVHDLLRELFEVVPAAREFVVEEMLAGLRPATTSGDPLIGPAPGDAAGDDARVLYAIGHYRNGVLLAPATAHRIAALVLGD